MGDCSLLALHCVAAWGLRSAQPRPLLDVELTLFEPIEDALVSLNAAVKAFQQSQHAAGNLAQKPQILVQPIALGPKVGYTQIHLRRASSAEASFVGCHGFQGECEVQEVWMETLDHLLLGDVPPVDLLKIHVQGSELDVLRGAREALRQGRICVTYVMTHAARIGQFEEVSSEEVVKAYLEIFSNHSVVASDGLTLGIPLQAVPAALKEEDKNYFVIAWHEGRLCRERPSVQAARELFGEVRQSGEDRD